MLYLSASSTDFGTVPEMADELIGRMLAQVARWEECNDQRAIFLDCYARMTGAVDTAMTNGRFDDGEWVGTLLGRFADYYFAALERWERGEDRVPEPWVLAHSAAVDGLASPIQLLVAGVNAHINYDLVLTLVDVLGPAWGALDGGARERRRGDYERINQTIADTADQVQDAVVERYSPSLDLLDRRLGRLDERWAVRVLTGWRRQVWVQAVDLLDEADVARRDEKTMRIEHRCARRARWLLL